MTTRPCNVPHGSRPRTLYLSQADCCNDEIFDERTRRCKFDMLRVLENRRRAKIMKQKLYADRLSSLPTSLVGKIFNYNYRKEIIRKNLKKYLERTRNMKDKRTLEEIFVKSYLRKIEKNPSIDIRDTNVTRLFKTILERKIILSESEKYFDTENLFDTVDKLNYSPEKINIIRNIIIHIILFKDCEITCDIYRHMLSSDEERIDDNQTEIDTKHMIDYCKSYAILLGNRSFKGIKLFYTPYKISSDDVKFSYKLKEKYINLIKETIKDNNLKSILLDNLKYINSRLLNF